MHYKVSLVIVAIAATNKMPEIKKSENELSKVCDDKNALQEQQANSVYSSNE